MYSRNRASHVGTLVMGRQLVISVQNTPQFPVQCKRAQAIDVVPRTCSQLGKNVSPRMVWSTIENRIRRFDARRSVLSRHEHWMAEVLGVHAAESVNTGQYWQAKLSIETAALILFQKSRAHLKSCLLLCPGRRCYRALCCDVCSCGSLSIAQFGARDGSRQA